MPKSGQYNETYPKLLEQENKLVLLEPFRGAKEHHKMKCLICGHEWVATPISKRQTYKKYNVSGCPECENSRKQEKHRFCREERKRKLEERGIVVLTEGYDFKLRLDYGGRLKDEKILVRNNNCGHEFYVTPLNLIQSEVECGVCGPTKRAEPLTNWSKANSAKWRETATEWQKYKSRVDNLTRVVYKNNKDVINPNNYVRDNAGVPGAYHLDHVVSKRFCFEHNIPAEICAHVTNLQMLPWRDNVSMGEKIKGNIPSIILEYVSEEDIAIYQKNEPIDAE